MHYKNALRWMTFGLALSAVSGCSALRGSRSAREDPPSPLVLTAFRARHRYVLPADLPATPMRVALVDLRVSEQRTQGALSVGMLRAAEGLFRAETDPLPCRSIGALTAAIDRHVDLMPVGIVMTVNGRRPGEDGGPPPAFVAFVSDLQAALDAEGIRYAFILLPALHWLR